MRHIEHSGNPLGDRSIPCGFGELITSKELNRRLFFLSFTRLVLKSFPRFYLFMASPFPNVLIVGHSFVKRLDSDLQCKFDHRAAVDFNLSQTANISLYGVGGLTVSRLERKLRSILVNKPLPRVLIIEIGTNDLSSQSPEIVIGKILELVQYMRSVESVRAVGFCKVIPRRDCETGLPLEDFNSKAATLNSMLKRFLTRIS